MNPTFDAFVRSWPVEPWFVCGLLLTAAIYLRGWLVLHRRDAARWPAGRPIAFAGGLFVLFLALASPIEPFASLLLQVHMLQHLSLMMIAPPLLWLGAPLFPMLRGLPRPIRNRVGLAALSACVFLRRLFATLTHPVPAWLLFTAATWIWHYPPVYELAARLPRRLASLAATCASLCGSARAVVLVSGGPAVPESAAMVALAADSLPDTGRRAKHDTGGGAERFCGSADLCVLRPAAATQESLRARGPGGGRSIDVGAGIDRVPRSPFRHWRQASLW